jgi:hypothetical protein
MNNNKTLDELKCNALVPLAVIVIISFDAMLVETLRLTSRCHYQTISCGKSTPLPRPCFRCSARTLCVG